MANPKGRNRKEFSDKDFRTIEGMAEILCTQKEIAGVMRVDQDTLNRRIKERYGLTYSQWYEIYSQDGRMSLRRKQFEVARNGNVNMLIWLGKQNLGQKDRVENENINLNQSVTLTDEQIEAILNND